MTTADRAREIVGDVIGHTADDIVRLQYADGAYTIDLDDALKAVEQALSQGQQGEACRCTGADYFNARACQACCDKIEASVFDRSKQQGREAVAFRARRDGTFDWKLDTELPTAEKVDELRSAGWQFDYLYTTPPAPVADAVRDALEEAIKSLRTIARDAGRIEFLEDMTDIRGYANSRANVAEAALAAQPVIASNLPERDASRPQTEQGLFRKFDVRRTDGSDAPGGKHDGCEYFVLDMTHDPHAKVAAAAYAASVEATHPALAAGLREQYGLAAQGQEGGDANPS